MLMDLMRKRRSIRRFRSEPLSEETLLKLVESAVTAPSAGNKQPWRFLIVRDKSSIETAAEAVNDERQRLTKILQPEFRAEFEVYSKDFSMFQNAPVLIVPLFRAFAGLSGMINRGAAEKDRILLRSLEHHNSLVSISLTIQNMLLTAEDLGMGACCMTGPLIAEDRLRKCLKVPEGWRIAALIAVGYPDETPNDPGRKSLKSFVRWL